MPKPVYEQKDVTVLWNQTAHTNREVKANRPDTIIKNKKTENMYTDRCGKCHAKEVENKLKCKSLCTEIK